MAERPHRIETWPGGKPVRVSVGGELVAESAAAVALDEKGLPLRWYLPREDVRAELLPSDTHTICPFKGQASYHSVKLQDGTVVEDLAWYYPHPLPGVREVADLLCFAGPDAETEVVEQAAEAAT